MSSIAIAKAEPADAREATAIVRRLLSAGSRTSVEEALTLTARDVVLETPFLQIWGVDEQGHDRVRVWLRRMKREWAFVECYRVDLEEQPEGRVLGSIRVRGRGMASRKELDWELHVAALVERGRIARLGLHLDRQQALSAIGLSL